MIRNYRTEFPDFDPATMPAISNAWTDVSWRNEPCPAFNTGTRQIVYIDYADPAAREFAEFPRFMVKYLGEDGSFIEEAFPFQSDDWAEVLQHVEETAFPVRGDEGECYQ